MSEASRLALIILATGAVVCLAGSTWRHALRQVAHDARQLELGMGWQRFWRLLTGALGPIGRLMFQLVYQADEGAPRTRRLVEDTRRNGTQVTDQLTNPELTQAPISQYYLQVIQSARAPGLAGRRFTLVDGVNAVGRACTPEPGVELIALPDDKAISRDHLYIEMQPDGSLTATDRGSRFGTRLNGQRLEADEPAVVRRGDRLQVGNTTLQVSDGMHTGGALETGVLRVEVGPVFRLRVVEGPDAGKALALNGRRVVIGRDSQADWRLTGSQVSRQHAEVWQEGEVVRIRDLGSTHGLLVNRHRHQNRALEVGDVIEIGENRVKFEAA